MEELGRGSDHVHDVVELRDHMRQYADNIVNYASTVVNWCPTINHNHQPIY